MIAVFGTICLDRIHRIPHLPPPGGYVEIMESIVQLGGEAANTAHALARWNARFELIGNPIGQGPVADEIRIQLAQHGLDNARLTLRDNPPPVCEIFVTPDGQRTMMGYGFAQLETVSESGVIHDLTGITWITVDPNLGMASRIAADRARTLGASVYWMDFPPPGSPNAPDYAPGDWWQSSTDRFGEPDHTELNQRLIKRLAEHGLNAVLTDGARGLISGGPKAQTQTLAAFSIEPRIDSTGAGDCFRAGMLYGLFKGWNRESTLAFASAAGALTCRGLGALSTTPTLAEIKALLNQNGFKIDESTSASP